MFSQNLIGSLWKTKEQTPRKEKHGWSSEPREEPSGKDRSGEQSDRSTKIKGSSKNSMLVLREGVRRLSRHEESDWKHPSGEHIGFCTQNLKDFNMTVFLVTNPGKVKWVSQHTPLFKSALKKSRPDWNSRETRYAKVYAPDWSVLCDPIRRIHFRHD